MFWVAVVDCQSVCDRHESYRERILAQIRVISIDMFKLDHLFYYTHE